MVMGEYLLKFNFVILTTLGDVYFTLKGVTYPDNSELALSDIGEGANALSCKTSLVDCCKTQPNRFGQFYYPNGTQVPVNSIGHGFFRDRGDQEIRLNRRDQTASPTGRFRCEIPDANRVMQSLHVTLT